MLSSAVTGTFHFAGQYHIGGDGLDYANSSHNFALFRANTLTSPVSIAAQVEASCQK
jgi:hypothetical protein